MNLEETRNKLVQELNRICKWRTVYAGWQLGTRLDTDEECKAVKDQRELLILMRVEVSALANVLIEKGVISLKDYFDQQLVEINELDHALQRKFPGFKATDFGISIDASVAKKTTQNWKP